MKECNSQESRNSGLVTLNAMIPRGVAIHNRTQTLFEILKNQCEPESFDGALSEEFQKLQVVTQMY